MTPDRPHRFVVPVLPVLPRPRRQRRPLPQNLLPAVYQIDEEEIDHRLVSLISLHDRVAVLRWEEDFKVKAERLKEDVEWCLTLLRVIRARDPENCSIIHNALNVLGTRRLMFWYQWRDHQTRQDQDGIARAEGGAIVEWLRTGPLGDLWG